MKKVIIALTFFTLLFGCEEGSDCPDCLDNEYQNDFKVLLEELLEDGEPYSYSFKIVGTTNSVFISQEFNNEYNSAYTFQSSLMSTGLQITKNYNNPDYSMNEDYYFFPYKQMIQLQVTNSEIDGTVYNSVTILYQ